MTNATTNEYPEDRTPESCLTCAIVKAEAKNGTNLKCEKHDKKE